MINGNVDYGNVDYILRKFWYKVKILRKNQIILIILYFTNIKRTHSCELFVSKSVSVLDTMVT